MICSSFNNFWLMIFHVTTIMVFHHKMVQSCPTVAEVREMCLPFFFFCDIYWYNWIYSRNTGVLMDKDSNLITCKHVLQHCTVFLANNVRQDSLLFFYHLRSPWLRMYPCVSIILWKNLMELGLEQTKLLTLRGVNKLYALFCSCHYNYSEFTI